MPKLRELPPPEITEPQHHLQRQVCCDCATRVFTYSTETAPGLYRKYRCTMCYHRHIGVPLCLRCQRPIERGKREGTWLHTDHTTRRYGHPAEPENPTPPVWRRSTP